MLCIATGHSSWIIIQGLVCPSLSVLRQFKACSLTRTTADLLDLDLRTNIILKSDKGSCSKTRMLACSWNRLTKQTSVMFLHSANSEVFNSFSWIQTMLQQAQWARIICLTNRLSDNLVKVLSSQEIEKWLVGMQFVWLLSVECSFLISKPSLFLT